MKKLRQKYKTEKDKKRRSGTNRAKEWKFFTKMDGFMSQKHNVNPPFVTDTMAEQEAQNTCKFRRDINCILQFSFLFQKAGASYVLKEYKAIMETIWMCTLEAFYCDKHYAFKCENLYFNTVKKGYKCLFNSI